MSHTHQNISPKSALLDLSLFLTLMFVVRIIHIDFLGFWGNALFRSGSVVGLATLLLYYRKQSWKDLGLIQPNNIFKMLGITVISLIGTIATIMLFEVVIKDLIFGPELQLSSSSGPLDEATKNTDLLFSTILFVWIESFLEELQDRGFSLNRFQSLFSRIPLSAILAVMMQAAIFGFRHSYDFSPRSMTTGLIGMVFGLVYVFSGRNLWPLIIAHVLLNTISMLE